MELRHIEVFVAVAREKSFTRAAEFLGLSQPTVSLHVQSLEKELGVRLFDREGRSVGLTPAGKVFFPYAQEMVALKEKALLALKKFLGSVEGTFVIGASTVPGEYILPKLLPEFVRQYPKTRFKVRVLDSSQVNALVADGVLELGVVGDRNDDDRLEYIPFCRDEVVIIAPVDHPGPLRITLQELSSLPLVLREPGSGTRRVFERALEERGLSVDALNVVAEMGSTTAVKEMVKGGVGCGVVYRISVAQELKSGELRQVVVEGLSMPREFALVHRKNRTLSPAIELLIDFVVKQKERKPC